MEAIQRAMMMDSIATSCMKIQRVAGAACVDKGALSKVKEKMQPSVPVFLGGFSHGVMLATDVALMEPSIELSGLILLSGTLLAEKRWTLAMPARKGLRVLQSHGTHDPDAALPACGALARSHDRSWHARNLDRVSRPA